MLTRLFHRDAASSREKTADLTFHDEPCRLETKQSTPHIWTVGTLAYTTGGLAVLFFWLLWGDFAWSMRDRAVPSVVQLLLRKFEASDLLVGLLISSLPCAIAMILGPIISFKSDRHRGRMGRRIPYLLITTPVATLSMVGLAFSPSIGIQLNRLLGWHSPGLNASILIIFGLFWVMFEIASITANAVFGGLVNDVVPQAIVGRFFGLFRAFSLIAGMIFNYWLLGKAETHFVWIFLGIGALYGVGFTLMCLKVREGQYPRPVVATNDGGFFFATKTYFRECFGSSYYLCYFAAMALAAAAFGPVNLFSVFYATSVHMSVDTYGACLALTYGISLILSYPLGALADRFHPLRVSLVAMGLYSLVTLYGGLCAKGAWTFGAALVMHGVLSGTYFTASASIGQRLLPRERFAELGSAAGIIGSLVSIVLAPAMGLFLDHMGHVYRYTFIIGFALSLLALLSLLLLHGKFMTLGGPKRYVAPE
jgi:MFS family permease